MTASSGYYDVTEGGGISIVEETPTALAVVPEGPSKSGRECEWEIIDPSKRYRALAIVTRDDEDSFTSICPSLPGAGSQGDSAEEAIENLKEALAGCIESYLEAGECIPWIREAGFGGDAEIKRWIVVDV